MSILVNGKEKFTLDTVLKGNEDADTFIIYGGKNIGKSYQVKSHAIEEAFNGIKTENNRMIYMRRWQTDIKRDAVERYFSGPSARGIIKKYTKGEFTHIFVKGDTLFFGNLDLKGRERKPILEVPCGYTMYISGHEHFASLEYEDVKNVLFEEWQTTGVYLNNEPDEVRKLINTIERDGHVHLWMCANTISIVCPYVTDWNLFRMPKQKQGTTDIYNIMTGAYDKEGHMKERKIVVHYCAETDKEKGFLIGNKKDMLSTGSWVEYDYPNYQYYDGLAEVLHTVVFQYDTFMFIMRLLKENDYLFWYVEPKTTPVKNIMTTRTVGNVVYRSNLYTKSFIGLNQNEQRAFDLIKYGRVFFCNNLTGTQFNTALKNLNRRL